MNIENMLLSEYFLLNITSGMRSIYGEGRLQVLHQIGGSERLVSNFLKKGQIVGRYFYCFEISEFNKINQNLRHLQALERLFFMTDTPWFILVIVVSYPDFKFYYFS